MFWFELPAPLANALDTELMGEPKGSKILLVEDDVQLNQLLKVVLAHDGYEPVVALNLKDASKHVLRSKPEAIILDVQLPDGNGLDWVKKHRDAGALENVPVIVLTGNALPEPSGRTRLTDWISKPFDRKQLLTTLREAVQKAGQEPKGPQVVDDDQAARSTSASTPA